MAAYLVFFNQQWVGEHAPEWFAARGVLARAVVEQMREAGVLVFAGGLVEDLEAAFSMRVDDGVVVQQDGPWHATQEWLGGMTIIDVTDEQEARAWAARIAEACGWPQEVRRFG